MAHHFIPILAGRQPQQRQLSEALADAAAGQGRLILLTGLAGSGKSRLTEWTLETAQQKGLVPLHGLCDEGEKPWPYGLFLDAFRRLRRRLTAEEQQRWFDSGAQWTRLVTFQPTPDPLSARQLYEEIYATLRRSGGPVLLALEDVHLADEASLDLLQWLSRDLSDQPWCIVATARSEGLAARPDAAARLHRLVRQAGAAEIALEGLEPSAVRSILESVLPGEAQKAALAQRLHERTGGSPLFLEEILRRMVTEGAGADAALPETFAEALVRRLPEVSPADYRVLMLAAVAGERFTVQMLAELAALAEQEVIGSLGRLLKLQLIREGDGGFRFWHALTRDALYDRLLVPERPPLHLRVAEHLLRLPEEQRQDRLAAIADHFERAGKTAEAAQYHEATADRALALGAHAAAFAHVERALLLTQIVAPRRAELTLKSAVYARAAGRIEEATGYCEQARTMFARAGNRFGTAEALVLQSRLRWLQGDSEGALARCHEALALRQGEEDHPAWAWAMTRIAGFLMLAGRYREVFPWGRRGLAMARRLGLKAAESACLNNMGTSYGHLGQVDRGLRYLRKALRLAKEAGDRPEACRGYVNQINILEDAGRVGEALSVAEAGAEYARSAGDPEVYRPWLLVTVMLYRWLTGDWTRALQILDQASEATEDQPAPVLRAFYQVTAARIYLDMGELERAEQLCSQALQIAETHGANQYIASARRCLAGVALARGDSKGAVEQVQAAFAQSRIGEQLRALDLALFGLEAACATGSTGVDGMVDQLWSHLQEGVPSGMRLLKTWADMATGLRHLYCRRFREAAQALEPVCEVLAECGLPLDEARAREWLATALFQAGTEEERREAARQRQLARSLLAKMVRRSAPDPLHPLSQREREVAALVARGLSNKEIGQALFIAERTVAVHVSRILEKLGLRSRSQVAGLLRG